MIYPVLDLLGCLMGFPQLRLNLWLIVLIVLIVFLLAGGGWGYHTGWSIPIGEGHYAGVSSIAFVLIFILLLLVLAKR